MDKLRVRFFDAINSLNKRRIVDKKRLYRSYVSLFLAVMIMITATFSWFSIKNQIDINSQAFQLGAANSLRTDDDKIPTDILIEDITLGEASSVDGRNVYFPITYNGNSTTTDMVFREATVGDQNFNYIYKDFTLTSDSSSDTPVYVNGYSITVGETTFDGSTVNGIGSTSPTEADPKDECPLRIAFITNSADNPKVIDPTALITQYSNTYTAVDYIDTATGSPTTAQSYADAFSLYNLMGTPLFTIPAGEDLEVTMVVWFEGGINTATGESKCDKWENESVSIKVELETVFDDYDTIRFIDNTYGDTELTARHWINSSSTDPCLVTITYQYQGADGTVRTRTLVMQEGDTVNDCPTWVTKIPNNVVTGIVFARFSTTNETVYNAWYTQEKVNDLDANYKNTPVYTTYTSLRRSLDTSREINGVHYNTYTALGGNAYSTTQSATERLAPCYGLWGTFTDVSDSGGGSDEDATSPTSSDDTLNDVTIGVTFKDQSSTHWVYNNCVNNGMTLYVELSDNSSYAMNITGSNYFEYMSITSKVGETITAFTLRNNQNTVTNTFSVSNTIAFTKSQNYSFELGSDDTVTRY